MPVIPGTELPCYHKTPSVRSPDGCPVSLRTAAIRAAIACLSLLATGRITMGSTTLLRTPSKIVPELEPVQTYAGKTDLVIFAVKPATAVTVVLLTDSLSPVETETVKKGLLA